MKKYIDKTSVVEKSSTIGNGTKVWHFTHIDCNTIVGENCTIGQNVYIGKNVSIGENVKIQNNVSIYSGVMIEDNVFCGPSAVFTNVLFPRSSYPNDESSYLKTLVKSGATIGANATIICGHNIGHNAMVGAGSVVTRDIKDGELVVGSPQKHIGWVCECGNKLDDLFICKKCGNKYRLSEAGMGSEVVGTQGD
ncbi:MAG: DapH/DapD/GlmU-related protein [Oscillospiraceae bacterium]